MNRFWLLFLALFFSMASSWTLSSWQNYPSLQLPPYPDRIALETVKDQIRAKPPLVFSGEIRGLRRHLREVAEGNAFLFQAGPCAETFDNSGRVDELQRLFTVMLQSSLILSYGLETKIIRIGRLAGQYAKPRSSSYESDQQTLTYRGDLFHSLDDRTLDPSRLLRSYYQSGLTLNCLRSFAKSGDLRLERIHQWMYPTEIYFEKYSDFLSQFQKTIKFMKNVESVFANEPEFFVSHEGLHLHYEEALTRQDSRDGRYYNCGAHTVWLGERTRYSEAHLHYLKGIQNPIGIKLGSIDHLDHLENILYELNPSNAIDKIMIIVRLGAEKISTDLPILIQFLKQKNMNAILVCDPCHANTQVVDGRKTRFTDCITKEVHEFFRICRDLDQYPGGVHLEISGSPLTECIGENVGPKDLATNYQSLVDPQLNNIQMISLAMNMADMIGSGSKIAPR